MDTATLLKILAAVESSNGKDTRLNSPATTEDRASGIYQIKPSQVRALPGLLKNSELPPSPEVDSLSKDPSNWDIGEELRTNPEINQKVGEAQGDVALKRGNNDLFKAAFLHHMGISSDIPDPNDFYDGPIANPDDSTVPMLSKSTKDKQYIQKTLGEYEKLPISGENIVDPGKFNRIKSKIRNK